MGGWLKPSQVAGQLGVHKSRVYQLIREGILPAVRVGGAIRIPTDAWDSWMKQQAEAALRAIRDVECGTSTGCGDGQAAHHIYEAQFEEGEDD